MVSTFSFLKRDTLVLLSFVEMFLVFFVFVFLFQSIEGKKSALLIIDVQNCFTKGGSLEVPDGDAVVDVINQIRTEHNFDLIVASLDWHPSGHVSFASSHLGKKPFDQVEFSYDQDGCLCSGHLDLLDPSGCGSQCGCEKIETTISQTLWPDHCVAETEGSKFHPSLVIGSSDVVVKKGMKREIDSYSAFYDNGNLQQTELHSILQQNGIEAVFLAGLARDYCVFFTALDAKNLGYEVYFVWDATRGISDSTSQAEEMRKKGITIVQQKELGEILAR